MSKGFYTRTIAISLVAIAILAGCRKRPDIGLPDNLVKFESTEQGLGESDTAITVKLTTSRPVSKDVSITVRYTEQNILPSEYRLGSIATVPGTLTLTIPSGSNETSFTVKKTVGVFYDGDEKISFEIFSSAEPVFIGSQKKFVLNFAELLATNAGFVITGGGPTYPNKVFIDLSANRQTAVLRTNWDLGFYTAAGTDSFRVTLNSTVGMMAKQINKNDLNTVTAADTVGFGADVAYSAGNPVVTQIPYIDFPNGDITRTAIGLVAANATDNKVYIVNRGAGVGTPAPGRGWKKIRILRNAGGGYTLQHADIAATTFTSIDIAKDDAYFFKYISFETGAVSVEPQKKKWDLAWSYSGFTTNFGGGDVPYLFQDLVFQNRNVLVAKVLEATKPYNDFVAANLTDATIPAASWSSSQSTIGSDWRRTTPSPAQTHADRYYIVRDGDGNYYKVRFTSLTDGGLRGSPSIAFVLVKKA